MHPLSPHTTLATAKETAHRRKCAAELRALVEAARPQLTLADLARRLVRRGARTSAISLLGRVTARLLHAHMSPAWLGHEVALSRPGTFGSETSPGPEGVSPSLRRTPAALAPQGAAVQALEPSPGQGGGEAMEVEQ